MAFALVHATRRFITENMRRRKQFDKNSAALTSIATSELTSRGDLNKLFELTTQVIAEAMHVDRVSIWRFSDDRSRLDCACMYVKSNGEHSKPPSLIVKENPRYFEALDTLRVLDAHDAHTDPLTSEFSAAYLYPNDIYAMLDSPIRVDGALWGVVCHEHVGSKRHWHSDEQLFAAAVGDQLAQAILAERHHATVKHEHELERQLMQSQKMEALGTLAGGIAHDFNNNLQAIISSCELIASHTDSLPDDVNKSIENIDKSANRAANLVRRILAFSRQSDETRPVIAALPQLNEFIEFMSSSTPPNIRFETNFEIDNVNIQADHAEIQQLLSNLVTNAIHATESTGGTISIGAKQRTIHENIETETGDLAPSTYLEISVADDGPGIPAELQDRIFEPFFTTKQLGKGTGLGLAMVHGITRDLTGGILLQSSPGQGTTITVLIPTTTAEATAPPTHSTPSPPQTPHGNILVVDDEEILANTFSEVLESLGYHVTVFHSPNDCIAQTANSTNTFDIALLDYLMPEKNGVQLAEELRASNPNLITILITGTTELAENDEGFKANIDLTLRKPLRIQDLANTIEELINAPETAIKR